MSLDVRHQHDPLREQACHQLEEQLEKIGRVRGISCNWQELPVHPAVPCASHLTELMAQAIKETGYPVHTLPSGAGHDAVVLARLTDIAMLFVRCQGGISHNPAEAVTTEDVAIAIQVLERFLQLLA